MVWWNNGLLADLYPFIHSHNNSFISYTFELKNEFDTHNGFIMSLAIVISLSYIYP